MVWEGLHRGVSRNLAGTEEWVQYCRYATQLDTLSVSLVLHVQRLLRDLDALRDRRSICAPGWFFILYVLGRKDYIVSEITGEDCAQLQENKAFVDDFESTWGPVRLVL